jgi:hypothetical protein
MATTSCTFAHFELKEIEEFAKNHPEYTIIWCPRAEKYHLGKTLVVAN